MQPVPIIYLTFNRLNYTMHSLGSIINNIILPTEIIVIDNGSTDGTVEFLKLMKDKGHIQTLILNDENKGIAEAKNQGLQVIKSKSKYIVITDNDIVVPFLRPKCILTYMIECMEHMPELGMLSADLQKCNSPSNQQWWFPNPKYNNKIINKGSKRQNPTNSYWHKQVAIISTGFWFSLTYRQLIEKAGHFKCSSNYGETDQQYRDYLTVNKRIIGVWKGQRSPEDTRTIPNGRGYQLGWTEDYSIRPDYVKYKKNQRFIAEEARRKNNKK